MIEGNFIIILLYQKAKDSEVNTSEKTCIDTCCLERGERYYHIRNKVCVVTQRHIRTSIVLQIAAMQEFLISNHFEEVYVSWRLLYFTGDMSSLSDK